MALPRSCYIAYYQYLVQQHTRGLAPDVMFACSLSCTDWDFCYRTRNKYLVVEFRVRASNHLPAPRLRKYKYLLLCSTAVLRKTTYQIDYSVVGHGRRYSE